NNFDADQLSVVRCCVRSVANRRHYGFRSLVYLSPVAATTALEQNKETQIGSRLAMVWRRTGRNPHRKTRTAQARPRYVRCGLWMLDDAREGCGRQSTPLPGRSIGYRMTPKYSPN